MRYAKEKVPGWALALMLKSPAADSVAPVGMADVACARTLLAVAAAPPRVSLASKSPLPLAAKLNTSPRARMAVGGTVITASALAQLLALALSHRR